jgi:hypothetical protein
MQYQRMRHEDVARLARHLDHANVHIADLCAVFHELLHAIDLLIERAQSLDPRMIANQAFTGLGRSQFLSRSVVREILYAPPAGRNSARHTKSRTANGSRTRAGAGKSRCQLL